MAVTGGCYCGALRYESTGEQQFAMQCHCRECQYITGGNPNVIIVVPADGFRFTKGEPKEFARSDLEKPVRRYFCADCGTAIGSRTPSRPDSFVIKVGTLDDRSAFKPQAAIFTIDRQPYHHIPDGLPSFERRPG
ncbi:GFA family protein [Minwuia sp.]|uniref:GFA family protein n=1 Tax=Minwuia sp. TaxID=2493630 RepID=UPI003A8CAA9A